MKQQELLARDFKLKLRKLQELTQKMKITLYEYTDAPIYAICVLSSSEYELGEERNFCSEQNTSYFVTKNAEIIMEKLGYY